MKDLPPHTLSHWVGASAQWPLRKIRLRGRVVHKGTPGVKEFLHGRVGGSVGCRWFRRFGREWRTPRGGLLFLLFAGAFPALDYEVSLFLAIPAKLLSVRDGGDGEVGYWL